LRGKDGHAFRAQRDHGAAPATTIVTTISDGRDQMPAFGRAYKPEELHDVSTYAREELAAH
jgi:mono/diheme cytochrome c family protein